MGVPSPASSVVPYRVLPLLHVVRDALALHGYTMTNELCDVLTHDTELLAVLQRLSFATLHHADKTQSQRLNTEI